MKELLSHLIILHLRKLHMTAMMGISTRGVQRLLHLDILLTVAILSYYYSHSNGYEVMTLSPLPSSHYFLFLLHSPNWHTVNYVDGAGFVPLRLPQFPFPYAHYRLTSMSGSRLACFHDCDVEHLRHDGQLSVLSEETST